MAAKPKKPKLRKYRQKPKQGAPVSSWEKYDDHVKDVDKANNKKMADYKKELRNWESEKKKKESLIKKYKK
jgi:hypothetical protein